MITLLTELFHGFVFGVGAAMGIWLFFAWLGKGEEEKRLTTNAVIDINKRQTDAIERIANSLEQSASQRSKE